MYESIMALLSRKIIKNYHVKREMARGCERRWCRERVAEKSESLGPDTKKA
jgi:hypothetical protein